MSESDQQKLWKPVPRPCHHVCPGTIRWSRVRSRLWTPSLRSALVRAFYFPGHGNLAACDSVPRNTFLGEAGALSPAVPFLIQFKISTNMYHMSTHLECLTHAVYWGGIPWVTTLAVNAEASFPFRQHSLFCVMYLSTIDDWEETLDNGHGW